MPCRVVLNCGFLLLNKEGLRKVHPLSIGHSRKRAPVMDGNHTETRPPLQWDDKREASGD